LREALIMADLPLDRMFEALADPTRRAMVERLSRGPASVSELAAPLPMSLPGVVQHLQVLEQSGLITTQKVGRTRTCTLDAGALSLVEKWINDRRIGWQRRLDRLGDFLDADEDKKTAPSPNSTAGDTK
jgi:DNA-binding transcriptional ArsR family regulator